jgi:hypothetical protein
MLTTLRSLHDMTHEDLAETSGAAAAAHPMEAAA